MPLADPRRYGPGDRANPLLQLAERDDERALTSALRELAAAGRDVEIGAALTAAPSRDAYARLWRALCAAVEKPGDEAVAPRVFAIPWIIVCGASSAASIQCVLPNVAEVAR